MNFERRTPKRIVAIGGVLQEAVQRHKTVWETVTWTLSADGGRKDVAVFAQALFDRLHSSCDACCNKMRAIRPVVCSEHLMRSPTNCRAEAKWYEPPPCRSFLSVPVWGHSASGLAFVVQVETRYGRVIFNADAALASAAGELRFALLSR